MAEEEEEANKWEEAEGNDKEYDESKSSIWATLEQMQIRQTKHLDALADI